ncbi:tRNA-2-methylthio-N6-dimethylallyladenosine synthase [Desulfonatronum thiosulfatophilum]|uniref:tRNA-2-methylthio-N(6)-dimethylallyladenosine synthase n=1 Tax=Desulfonatronum thiosulfatophilum TaxID=617002 RepID=A0A1G6DQA1_9BACT|nr:tRNA (N6-isopentenyl adenosine(37)-C2)-methylthiotransferase MiaB [Desulfonatronum thiosulfatophilum]SDB47354.1 tRNA-2-methylthio-N6-dimethylallyladenosine synthase [Desulfonatronum thiosulfatophilum]
MRFHITTFGCQMNVHDSQWLGRTMRDKGWEDSDEDQAEVLILNTCSVRDKPEQKVYSHLGRLRDYWSRNPELFVAVGGCVAQQVGEAFFARFPYVRLVFGPDGLPMVPEALARLSREPGLRLSLLDFTESFPERDTALPDQGVQSQAFVNIMQGCDNYCAYCIVPLTRGRQRSRNSEAVIAECRSLLSRGVRDLTLLGQNVNSYGLDTKGREPVFSDLLRNIAELPGLRRLRFTTSHPKDLSSETIAAFGRFPNLCPQLHLPLQSGSNAVLRAMGRKYTLEHYLDKVELLRRERPEIALSTDLIVGFPGETDQDFEQTLEAMRHVGFESSYSFMYSDRPGTRAASMENKIIQDVKAARLKTLQDLQNEISQAALQERVGQRAEVLVEGRSKKRSAATQCFRGRDESGRTVNFAAPSGSDLDFSGQIVSVRILEAKKHSLWGCMEEVP